MKKKCAPNKARDNRIGEITADAYDGYEVMLGWMNYLEENISFPFEAECIEKRKISPLRKGEKVTALELLSEDDSRGEFFVLIQWGGRKMGVPLAQLKPLKVGKEAKQAIEDWQYWKARGYEF